MEQVIFPKNEENAIAMAQYMKNRFPFAGVPKPQRAFLQKSLLTASKNWSVEDVLVEITTYYQKEKREYQYLAIDLAQKNVRRFSFEELEKLLVLTAQKEWWDSIDSWRKFFGTWILQHPEKLEAVFLLFDQQPDFWLRRIAITLQLQFKEKTDRELLKKAIEYDMNTEEFFIQKAIGWALREYSKTNPEWVRQVLLNQHFSKLATREASKYL
ncbi:DNA alkylation repair protein [Enterococcus sp. JM9B]|uniref:DNA alkylation repair protein n=1 Tax=Enterococcus sp. JM9B TaxID=1857216 RepID=UPI001374C4F1|nr:DNA alkylation repair protein [Enterococcus sp. JM9B]KAF1300907.1 6-O-methylguanine DNA methyltransferase [Enterococcus sp. JM9B]